MEHRTYHGAVTPDDFARALIAEFDQGNLEVQVIGRERERLVQIASRRFRASGGQTAISVHLVPIEDGVLVRLGEQQSLGVAASLGQTALAALRNPLTLLGRLDDLAQDIGSLQISQRIWATIDRTADALGASQEISERLRRVTCAYCWTANPVGEAHCMACGAPLGRQQPVACGKCGHVSPAGTATCLQCGAALSS
ncbi:MAG: zinc ribbon domain-containing protein [Chloroflexota bacterium]